MVFGPNLHGGSRLIQIRPQGLHGLHHYVYDLLAVLALFL